MSERDFVGSVATILRAKLSSVTEQPRAFRTTVDFIAKLPDGTSLIAEAKLYPSLVDLEELRTALVEVIRDRRRLGASVGLVIVESVPPDAQLRRLVPETIEGDIHVVELSRLADVLDRLILESSETVGPDSEPRSGGRLLAITIGRTSSGPALLGEVIRPLAREMRASISTIESSDSADVTGFVQRLIRDCNALIADVTDANPNTYYLLGYASAVRRMAIVLTQSELPFNFPGVVVLRYLADEMPQLREQLREVLTRVFDDS